MVAFPDPTHDPPTKTFPTPVSVTLVYEKPVLVAAPIQCELIWLRGAPSTSTSPCSLEFSFKEFPEI